MRSRCIYECTYTRLEQGDFRDPGRPREASRQRPPTDMIEASVVAAPLSTTQSAETSSTANAAGSPKGRISSS